MSQDVAVDPRPRQRRRRFVLLAAIALVLVVAISLVAVSCLSRPETGPPTVKIDRGPVALAVSATGNIAPSSQQSLGFADGGTVSQVMVKVGDRVTAGQTLARIDDTLARQTLAQRQATLDQQVATLQKLQGGNSVQAAQASLAQARAIESRTRAQASATDTANRSATSRARAQLAFDQSSLDRAQSQLRADRSSCEASPRATTQTAAAVAQPATGGAVGTPAPTAVQTSPRTTVPPVVTPPATGGGTPTGSGGATNPPSTGTPSTSGSGSGSAGSSGSTGSSSGTGSRGSRSSDSSFVDAGDSSSTGSDNSDSADRSSRGARSRGASTGSSSSSSGAALTADPPARSDGVVLRADSAPLDDDISAADDHTGSACSRLISDRQSVTQAQGTVVSSRTSLDSAQQREKTDAASNQVSIANAQNSVVTAQNQLGTAGNDAPKDIDAQAAQVRDARAGVALAQQDLDQTVITAPVAGTITAINGTTGEVVSAPSAVTALAPGGTAPLPALSGGTSTSGGSSTGAPGAGAFVVLDSAEPFQLVVPFEEADAARLQPGQQVSVSVDALPDDPLTGRVTSVAPAGQNQSGIINYYATVVVDGGADRLRDGQTAEADVRVESVDNVLRVPAAAVRRDNGRPTVTIAGPDGKPVAMPFLAGLVGDDYVEVRSGLPDGAQVQLPQATVTPAPSRGGPPGN